MLVRQGQIRDKLPVLREILLYSAFCCCMQAFCLVLAKYTVRRKSSVSVRLSTYRTVIKCLRDLQKGHNCYCTGQQLIITCEDDGAFRSPSKVTVLIKTTRTAHGYDTMHVMYLSLGGI